MTFHKDLVVGEPSSHSRIEGFSMKVFVDWGITKEYEIIYEDENRAITHNTSEELILPPNSEVYLESGCPHFLLYQLIEKRHKIFICQGKEVKILRDELKLKKDDKTDVALVNILFHQKPDKFVELTKQSYDDIKLKFIVGKFEQLTKVTTGLKNRRFFAEKEYGRIDLYDKTIAIFEEEKTKLIDSAMPLLSPEFRRLKHIKGVDKRLIARLISIAHPRDFPTLSKWLVYCGYKGFVLSRYKKGKGKRPNYQAKSILHLMAKGTMVHGDKNYRSIYDQCKERYSKEHPDYIKGRIHGMALNRVATLIAKEIWNRLHDVSRWSLIEELRSGKLKELINGGEQSL